MEPESTLIGLMALGVNLISCRHGGYQRCHKPLVATVRRTRQSNQLDSRTVAIKTRITLMDTAKARCSHRNNHSIHCYSKTRSFWGPPEEIETLQRFAPTRPGVVCVASDLEALVPLVHHGDSPTNYDAIILDNVK